MFDTPGRRVASNVLGAVHRPGWGARTATERVQLSAMASKSFDAIVIGTGQCGVPLALKLAHAGQTVAVVERGRFGGTCVNTGCIPTKTMVASAYVAHAARRASEFGVDIAPDGVRVDMKRVKARKDRISEQSSHGIEKALSETPNCTVFRGHARFLKNDQVAVKEDVLTARQIFINVGERATIPNISGLNDVPYLTNSSILEIDYLPKSLIIVGGSYVALEFGQMFKRFGSDVSILERGPRLLSREDEDISSGVSEILANEGISVQLNAENIHLSIAGKEIEARTKGQAVVGTHVLMAVGRRPNTDDLGLENTGVKRDQRGFIEVDEGLASSVPGVWAIGDCNGRGGFTHTSYNDYEIVAGNLLGHEKRRVSDRISAYAVYIDPPLGRAGMSEADVRKSGRRALVGKREMKRVGRAVEKGETQGFMKFLVDADSKEILGGAILGTGGDEAIHCVLDMMYAKAPYTTLQRAMHIHPTVSELIPTVLGDLKPL